MDSRQRLDTNSTILTAQVTLPSASTDKLTAHDKLGPYGGPNGASSSTLALDLSEFELSADGARWGLRGRIDAR